MAHVHLARSFEEIEMDSSFKMNLVTPLTHVFPDTVASTNLSSFFLPVLKRISHKKRQMIGLFMVNCKIYSKSRRALLEISSMKKYIFQG